MRTQAWVRWHARGLAAWGPGGRSGLMSGELGRDVQLCGRWQSLASRSLKRCGHATSGSRSPASPRLGSTAFFRGAVVRGPDEGDERCSLWVRRSKI
ncbi:MAG: hypothetical protein M0Q13_08055 [Methanothrix sp.]|nr:hypothetical protein [Methanothrix sp.]